MPWIFVVEIQVQLFHVDLMPDFEPVDPASLSFDRPVAKVTDEQVDEALANIAKNSRNYEDKDGAAADGDQLTIDFLGKIDGVPFEGGAANGAPLTLGSKQFIPGFEEQLVGAKVGEERVLNVTFPEDYGAAALDKARSKLRELGGDPPEDIPGPSRSLGKPKLAAPAR